MSRDTETSGQGAGPDHGEPRAPWWRGPVGAWLLVGAAVRVAYVLLMRGHPRFEAPTMDAGYHLAWARAVASGETFQEGPFFRAPLYPYFLALWTALSPGSTLLARLAQAVLGGVTAALTARLAASVAGRAAAWVAGGLVALSPVLVAFDAELLIPTLLVPLLLVALDLCVRWGGDDRPRAALLTGLAFGVAAIARPNVLLLMPVLFAWTLLRTRRARAGAALAAGVLLPILPVTLHNAAAGDAALVSTQAGVNFWIGNNPESDGVTAIVPGTRQGWWEGYHDAIAAAERAEGRPLLASEVSRHYAGRALDWMGSDPAAAARLTAWKAWLLAANVELANNQDIEFTARRTLPALRFSPSRWDVLLGLGLVGLGLLWRRGRPGAGVLLTFLGVYGLSIVAFFVNSRFRVPLWPVLAVGAGSASVALATAVAARRWREVALVALPAALLAAGSNVLPAAVSRSDAAGYADLGRAELARGDAAAALAHLQRATALSPGSVQIRMALAVAIVEATGDAERALRSLQEVFPRATGHDRAELEARILSLRVSTGDGPAVLAQVTAALRARPGDGALRFVLAMAQASSGQAPGAAETLEALLVDEPTNVTAALFLGALQEELGRVDAARRTFLGVRARGALASPAERATAEAALARLGPG